MPQSNGAPQRLQSDGTASRETGTLISEIEHDLLGQRT